MGGVAVFFAHIAAGRSEQGCVWVTDAAETQACWSPILHCRSLLVPGGQEHHGRFMLLRLTGSFDFWKAKIGRLCGEEDNMTEWKITGLCTSE